MYLLLLFLFLVLLIFWFSIREIRARKTANTDTLHVVLNLDLKLESLNPQVFVK